MCMNDQHRLPQEAAVFVRGPKNSDINTLTEIVSFSKPNSLPATLVDCFMKETSEKWIYP